MGTIGSDCWVTMGFKIILEQKQAKNIVWRLLCESGKIVQDATMTPDGISTIMILGVA